jgi:hypothetical protein
MQLIINAQAAKTRRLVAGQLLRTKEDLMIISRDPAMVPGLVNVGARVRYLGPWGSAGAYLVEQFG